jgi:ABC-2 type transport system permease protein
MRAPAATGFVLVAARELRWIRRDRTALFLLVGVPLIAFFILGLTFSNAVIRGLNTVVVDADGSAASRTLLQSIAAAPGITLSERANDLTAAMQAIRSGKTISAVYIPANFERDLFAGRRPQVSVFYNTQFMTPGNSAGKALTDAINGGIATLVPQRPPVPATVGSLQIEQYVLTNPAFNYAQFLLRAILPMVLHVVVAIGTCYAVGSEFRRRRFGSWLRCAGGRPLVALAGKLAPLFMILVLQMVVVLLIIHRAYQIPFRGDAIMMAASAFLMIGAYQGLAATLVLLVKDLPLGLSLTGIMVSPAFGYAGVGFPVFGMNAFAFGWGQILPLRWYMQILFDQAARGAPVADSAPAFASLAGLAFLYLGFAWLRLRALRRHARDFRHAMPPAPTVSPSERPWLHQTVLNEVKRVLSDRGVKGLMILAPLLYAAFYPQPYLGQTLRHIPIAVVDLDRTELSRSLIMNLDADASVRVAVRADTLAEAQAALFRRQVFGIIEIPAGATRDFLKGNPARLPAYVDAAYFLVFSKTLQGIAESAATVTLAAASHDARSDGIGGQLIAAVSPATILPVPLFNPTGGYASYVVPAAFVLILQQTLLMGAAMLSGVAFETGGRQARRARTSAVVILGNAIAHLLVYVPALLLFLVVLPRVYGFSALGNPRDLFIFAITFILTTSLFGQAVGSWFKHRETPVLLFIATTLPQFFLVGLSWPVEAVPPILRTFGHIFPSEAAIDGLVRINQMGASLRDVLGDWTALIWLAAAYYLVAVLGSFLRRRVAHAG